MTTYQTPTVLRILQQGSPGQVAYTTLASTASGQGAALIGSVRSETGALGFTLAASEQNRMINVKTDCGAIGDGVHDDTAAINLANTMAASKTNKGTVYFPNGLYLTTSGITIPAGVNWLAESPGWTGAGPVCSGVLLLKNHAQHAVSILSSYGQNGVYIEGVGILGMSPTTGVTLPGNTGGDGFHVGPVPGVVLRRCNVWQANGANFYMGDGSGADFYQVLDDCYSSNPWTGANFVINSFFFHGHKLQSDGGQYGINFATTALEWVLTGDCHLEGYFGAGVICAAQQGRSSGLLSLQSTNGYNVPGLLVSGGNACTFDNVQCSWQGGATVMTATATIVGNQLTLNSTPATTSGNGLFLLGMQLSWAGMTNSQTGTALLQRVSGYGGSGSVYALPQNVGAVGPVIITFTSVANSSAAYQYATGCTINASGQLVLGSNVAGSGSMAVGDYVNLNSASNVAGLGGMYLGPLVSGTWGQAGSIYHLTQIPGSTSYYTPATMAVGTTAYFVRGAIGVAITTAGSKTRINNSVINNAGLGVLHGSANVTLDGCTFNACFLGVLANGQGAGPLNILNCYFVSSGAGYDVNHVGGAQGLWTGNTMSAAGASFNPGYTGVAGSFAGIAIRDNAGYVSRASGVVGSQASAGTIAHGLAGAPQVVTVTPNAAGMTGPVAITAIGATTVTVSWPGTTPLAVTWEARMACDF